MLTAIDGGGSVVSAYDMTRNGWESFFCPECGNDLVLHKGSIKIHHFSHRSNSGCFYGSGESHDHHSCKLHMYESLRTHPKFKRVEMEHKFHGSNIRADVALQSNNGHRIGIEVQRSSMTCDVFAERTQKYLDSNIAVLWILPTPFKVDGQGRIAPLAWQKRLHELNFGRVYVWKKPDDYIDRLGGGCVTAVHFDRCYLDSGRMSRRFRIRNTSQELLVVNSFHIVQRGGFKNCKPAKIFHDYLTERWW